MFYYYYLYPHIDYENFEFHSPINPWNIQLKYKADFDKIKCLEITLKEGNIIYIPAYWWYSIKFNKKSSISCFFYRTYMNNIAISPHIAMYALQIQNVKRDVVKKKDINGLMIQKTSSEKEENTTSIDNIPTSTTDAINENQNINNNIVSAANEYDNIQFNTL